MRLSVVTRGLGALVVAVALPVSAASLAPITFRFERQTVTIQGVSRGGAVAFFAVAKEPSDGYPPEPLQTRHAVLLNDVDGNGEVVFERDRAVPLIGIWIAVDVLTGRWVAEGSPGFDARNVPLGDVAKKDNVGQMKKLTIAWPEVDILCVRPGIGAWRLYVAKTSGIDESAPEEKALRVDMRRMIPLSDSPPPPSTLRGGDIIVVVDPATMRFAVMEVAK